MSLEESSCSCFVPPILVAMPHTVQASFEGLELELQVAWQSLRQLMDQIMTKTNGNLSHDDYMVFYHKVFSLVTTKRVGDRGMSSFINVILLLKFI